MSHIIANKSALFLIQTPLHVINSIEAIRVFEITRCTFFVVFSKHNKKWLKTITSLLPDNENCIFCERNDFDVEACTKEYVQHINKLKRSNFDYVFFSDSRLYIFVDIVKYLQNPHTYLMDDGTGTILSAFGISRHNEYFDRASSLDEGRKKLINDVKKKYKLDKLESIKYGLFSVFDFKLNSKVNFVNNPMQSLQKTHVDVDESSVLFLGQPFVNLGYLDANSYLSCLKKISEIYKDKSIFYLPHPREKEDNISDIKEKVDFNILKTNVVAEMFIMQMKKASYIISGFYSTALWNVAKYQPGLYVNACRIPKFVYNKCVVENKTLSQFLTNEEVIDLYYEQYQSRMDIIDI